jgi:aspartate/methionine/tyrosine aminotransferase
VGLLPPAARRDRCGARTGAAFGARGEGYARVSLAAADETVREGMRRLAEHLDRMRDAAPTTAPRGAA